MKHIHTFESFLNEKNIFEGMSFSEIKDKYLENPYGIGANSVEYVEGKNGNPAMLIFRDEDKRGRDDVESKLKSMGVPAKKLSKSTADKAYKYRYELTMYESSSNEALLGKNAKPWKVAYAGKGFYGVTNGGNIEGEMSKEEAEKEAEKRNSANLFIVNESTFREMAPSYLHKYYNELKKYIK